MDVVGHRTSALELERGIPHNPNALLVITLSLLFMPSVAPRETSVWAWNQLRIRWRWERRLQVAGDLLHRLGVRLSWSAGNYQSLQLDS
jgi:hypothetical protein